MGHNNFEGIVEQLKTAVIEVSSSKEIEDTDLRDVLAFLTKVAQVVDQSFQDVYTLAIEVGTLRLNDLGTERVHRLQKDIELLVATSHYRESLEICSRLKHLKERFNSYVLPAISSLPNQTDWQELFWLIEDREGRIIMMVERSVRELRELLRRVDDEYMDDVRRAAWELADELRPLLMELRNLTNQVLGLSGRRGFLELIRDRSELRSAASVVVNQGAIHMARDIFNVERAGAVGPNASATNTTFIENRGEALAGVDLSILLGDLARLKAAMQSQAKGTSEYAALAAVSEAEDAAKQNDKPTVVAKLKAAGQWALNTATSIGVSVAAKAIESSMGMS